MSILCVLFSSGGCNRVLSVSNCVFFEKKNTRLGTECTRLHPPLEKRGHVLVVPESIKLPKLSKPKIDVKPRIKKELLKKKTYADTYKQKVNAMQNAKESKEL